MTCMYIQKSLNKINVEQLIAILGKHFYILHNFCTALISLQLYILYIFSTED
jgi:hypothetical protein